MSALRRAAAFADAHLPWFVLATVCLGLAFPQFLSRFSPYGALFMAVMTFASTLGSGFSHLLGVFRRPAGVAATLVVLHVVMPLLTLGLGRVLFPQAPLFTTGLVLEYAIPTAVASLMWVGICGGDMPLAISIVLLDTLLAPIILPLTLRVLLGSAVALDAWGMLGDLMWMVAVPAVAAMMLHRIRPAAAAALKPQLVPFSRVAMFLLIGANASECAPFLRRTDATLFKVMVVVFLLCLGGFFLGFLAAKALKLPFAGCLSLCFCSGMRNISAGAVLAARYFPPEVLFPVAFSPVFLQLTTSVIAKVLLRLGRGAGCEAQP